MLLLSIGKFLSLAGPARLKQTSTATTSSSAIFINDVSARLRLSPFDDDVTSIDLRSSPVAQSANEEAFLDQHSASAAAEVH